MWVHRRLGMGLGTVGNGGKIGNAEVGTLTRGHDVVDPSSYPRARDLFCAAKGAADEVRRYGLTINRMRDAEGMRAKSLAMGHGSGGTGDAMAQTNSRMDFERSMAPKLREDGELIDYARSVLFGREGNGGVVTLGCTEGALAVSSYYLDGLSRHEVCSMLDCARSTIYALESQCFDTVDFHGYGACITGDGQAE